MFKSFIDACLIYNVGINSAGQQSDSVTRIHILCVCFISKWWPWQCLSHEKCLTWISGWLFHEGFRAWLSCQLPNESRPLCRAHRPLSHPVPHKHVPCTWAFQNSSQLCTPWAAPSSAPGGGLMTSPLGSWPILNYQNLLLGPLDLHPPISGMQGSALCPLES